MADLWSEDRRRKRAAAEPLASRMRPRSLDDFVGQEHAVGPGKLLRRMLDSYSKGGSSYSENPEKLKEQLAAAEAWRKQQDTQATNLDRGSAKFLSFENLRS